MPARDFGDILVTMYCISRDADYALACCRLAATRNFPAYRMGGFTWFYGDFECTAYSHAQEPNGRIPDAITNDGWLGIATARSLHPGGVNGLMADGAVRFFNDSIVRKVGAASARGTAASWSSNSAPRTDSGITILVSESGVLERNVKKGE